jgi:hypothetical protein
MTPTCTRTIGQALNRLLLRVFGYTVVLGVLCSVTASSFDSTEANLLIDMFVLLLLTEGAFLLLDYWPSNKRRLRDAQRRQAQD